MLNTCLTVEKISLETQGVIAPKGEVKYTSVNNDLWSKLSNSFYYSGIIREMADPEQLQTNLSYKQVAAYFYITREEKFMIYQVDHSKTALLIGGLMHGGEMVTYALYRKFYGDVDLSVDGRKVELNDFGKPDFSRLKEHIRPVVIGVLDDEREGQNKANFGVIAELALAGGQDVSTKRSTLKPCEFVSPQEYVQRRSAGAITPESWSDIVFENRLLRKDSS